MNYEFSTPEPPRLRGGIASGRIDVETADTDRTVVDVTVVRGDPEGVKVEQHGRDVVVEQRKKFGFKSDEYEVRVRAPYGADVDFNVASADVRADGRLGSFQVNAASGDIVAGDISGNAKVRSASGDVALGRVGGSVDVNTASGDVRVDFAGAGATVRSASGDVAVREVAKRVTIQTASGDQLVETVAEGSLNLKSASGDVHVGIRQGSRLRVDARSLSGDTVSEVELSGVEVEAEGPLVELNAATMSGDIRIVRA